MRNSTGYVYLYNFGQRIKIHEGGFHTRAIPFILFTNPILVMNKIVIGNEWIDKDLHLPVRLIKKRSNDSGIVQNFLWETDSLPKYDIRDLSIPIPKDIEPIISIKVSGVASKISNWSSSAATDIASKDNLKKHFKRGYWNNPENLVFKSAIEISLGASQKIKSITLSLDSKGQYSIDIYHNNSWLNVAEIFPQTSPGMIHYQILFSTQTPATNLLRVRAIKGDGMYSIGHLKIN
jgi:hypothetical protein